MRIAILGTGTMGKAVIEGLRSHNPAAAIIAYDAQPAALASLPENVTVAPPTQWFGKEPSPDAIIFAVKPSDIPAACTEVYTLQKNSTISAPLWISIAAGISIAALRSFASAESRICRVMPNTPARIGEGMSAYSCSDSCSDNDTHLVETIFGACGKTVAVPEKLMHAVTGLSGSGPAYVFLFIESLIEGGVTAGLPLPVARECAIQTVLGAARMVSAVDDPPGVLKAGVMSPGGTTAAGLRVLEQHAFKHAVIAAVTTATERSAQLGS